MAPNNIISCGAEDAEVLTHIWRKSILELAPLAFSKKQILAWVGRVRAPAIYAQEAKHRKIWGWSERGNLIAFIELEPNGHIDRLYALKEASGRGIATHLVEHVINYAAHSEVPKLFTEASDLARPVFERCTFEIIRKNPVNIDGVLMHNWLMERDLSNNK